MFWEILERVISKILSIIGSGLNPRWQPRNGCDGRLMAKILITTIQVNLVPSPSGGGNANSPELL